VWCVLLGCLFFTCKSCTLILKRVAVDCSWGRSRMTGLPLPYLTRALIFSFTSAAGSCASYVLVMTCFHSLWLTTNWSWCAKPLAVDTELLGCLFTNQQGSESIRLPFCWFAPRSLHRSKLWPCKKEVWKSGL